MTELVVVVWPVWSRVFLLDHQPIYYLFGLHFLNTFDFSILPRSVRPRDDTLQPLSFWNPVLPGSGVDPQKDTDDDPTLGYRGVGRRGTLLVDWPPRRRPSVVVVIEWAPRVSSEQRYDSNMYKNPSRCGWVSIMWLLRPETSQRVLHFGDTRSNQGKEGVYW